MDRDHVTVTRLDSGLLIIEQADSSVDRQASERALLLRATEEAKQGGFEFISIVQSRFARTSEAPQTKEQQRGELRIIPSGEEVRQKIQELTSAQAAAEARLIPKMELPPMSILVSLHKEEPASWPYLLYDPNSLELHLRSQAEAP
ncbi:MAG: hypothetical protein H7Z38_17025 [Rubrivivax sp.]|nr:hypothetical protein [Pyrinomonadaceae bacterium]